MDHLRPLTTSTAPIITWCGGDVAAGLRAFDGDSNVGTAIAWKRFLLEGTSDTVPLIASRPPYDVQPTFVCASRLAALTELAPRLSALDSGTLSGQRNCQILLGPRGSGKSRFAKSLVHVVAQVAQPTTCVIYVNFQNDGVKEPLHLLQAAFAEPGGLELPPALRREDGSLSDMLDFMRERNRHAFLVIDEVEELYKRPKDCPLADCVYRQLHIMGELDGDNRPVMLLASGRAAVLRTLVFSVAGYDLNAAYPCYMRWRSLNDRKFAPLTLRPVTAANDAARALLCVNGAPLLLAALVQRGCVLPPADVGAVGGHDNAIALRYTVTPEYLAWVCARCRGLASWIGVAARGELTREPRLNRLLGTEPARREALQRLFEAWEASVIADGRNVALAAADVADPDICAFGMPLGEHDRPGTWHQLMDEGVVFFNDAPLARTVHFLHPSDAGTLLLQFRRTRAAAELSVAEQLSLLSPQLASADEM